MAKAVDRACMTVSGTPGTGVITLSAAVSLFQTFAAAGVANGDLVTYVIEDGSNWELGEGTYASAGPTLTRTTVIASSNANAAISATSSAVVFVTAKANDFVGTFSQSLTAGQKTAARANLGVGVGMSEISRTTVGSAVAAVTFTGTWTDYDKLVLAVRGLSGSATARPVLEVSADSGSTWIAFTGQYFKAFSNTSYIAGTLTNSTDPTQQDNVAADTFNMLVTVFDLNTAAIAKMIVGQWGQSQGAAGILTGFTASAINAINGIRIRYASGNVDAGTVILYGAG